MHVHDRAEALGRHLGFGDLADKAAGVVVEVPRQVRRAEVAQDGRVHAIIVAGWR